MSGEEGSLRSRVLRGGFYLTLRQGLGLAAHIGGVIVLTRTIGPEAYGLYAAALALTIYLSELSQWGVGVYLVRRPGELDRSALRQASTLLLLLGSGGVLIGEALVPGFVRWTGLGDAGLPARLMIAALPLVMLSAVPLAALERALDYRRVAWIELGCLLLYYAVAILLAFAGWGVWAPVTGWLTQQVVLFATLHISSSYVPKPSWDKALAREMVSYGLSFSASIWVWQARNLVNPVLVGRFLGAEAVGIVALTHQLVRNLGFVLTATWRLSTAALARVQEDADRLLRAISEGMQLQTLAVAPPLVAMAWLAPLIIPLAVGAEWAGVSTLFPYIALGFLTNALFNLHSSALYVREWNWDVAVFHLAHIALFAGGAAVLLPTVGLVGYGVAELVAIPSYALVHYALSRRIGVPSYAGAAWWWAAFGLALFPHEIGWWVIAAPIAVALLPSSRRTIRDQVRVLKGAASG